jgi:hypothetical protein
MFTRLLNAIARKLPARCIRREDGKPYLYRYYLLGGNTEGWELLLHRFVASDPGNEVHNHPWRWALSLILAGGYDEERWSQRQPSDRGEPWRVWWSRRRPGTVNRLGPGDHHRVILAPGKEAWSLFFHGKRMQPWGFVHRHTLQRRIIDTRTFDGPEARPEA